MHQSLSLIIIQLATITIMAKLLGGVFQKTFKLSRVLGEIVAGIIIGPSLLGGISLALLGGEPLFPSTAQEIISPIIYNFSNLAAVILVFIIGLETDVTKFLRYSSMATLVAIGGYFASFFLGALTVVLLIPSIHSIFHPAALVVGALATTTSALITARTLSGLHSMSTPEADTILTASMLDDVLAMLSLTVVLAVLNIGVLGTGSAANASLNTGMHTIRALLFTLGASTIGILFAPRLVHVLKRVCSMDTLAAILLSLALIMAFLAELSGLPLIVGAYIAGLSLCRTDIANELREQLHGLYLFFVPIFFATMGMMVNIQSFLSWNTLIFGLIFCVICILAKILGSGALAMMGGARFSSALRIGMGMTPRGEFSLIIAGTGLSLSILNQELFATMFLAILFSGILTPPLLRLVFKSGGHHSSTESESEDLARIHLSLPSSPVASFLTEKILDTFREEEYFVNALGRDRNIYQIRKDMVLINLKTDDQNVDILFAESNKELIRLLVVEAMVELQDIFKDLQNFKSASIVEDLRAPLTEQHS